MNHIETFIPLLIIVILSAVYLIMRYIIRIIRVDRVTQNSLKNCKKSSEKIKKIDKTPNQKEIEEIIDVLISKHSDTNIEKAITEVLNNSNKNVREELETILNEIKLGMPESRALERLYNKTKNPKVYMLYQMLYLYEQKMISKKDIVDYFEEEKKQKEEFKSKFKKYIEGNSITAKILSVISLSIVAIVFTLIIEHSGSIAIAKWIEFFFVIILTYLIYFEINNYFTSHNYKRISEIRSKIAYQIFIRILKKNNLNVDKSIELLEKIYQKKISNKDITEYKKEWESNKNVRESTMLKYLRQIEKEMKKIPYKLGINWSICTTIILITIIYLTK